MKKKILSIILSFTMIFSTTGFAFADTDLDNPPAESVKVEKEVKTEDSSQEKIEKEEPQKEDVKQEENKQEEVQNKEEPQKEEVKQEEPQKEVKQTNDNEEIKKEIKSQEIEKETTKEDEDENEEVNYPIKVTWHLKYRDANGEWTEYTSSTATLKNKTRDCLASSYISSNRIIRGDLINETEQKIYVFNNSFEYTGSSKPVASLGKIIAAGKDYDGTKNITCSLSNKTTDIYITAGYAEYNIIEPYKVTYNVHYRDSGHNQVDGWVTKTKTISVNEKGIPNTSWSGIKVAYNEMVGNRLIEIKTVPYQNVYYTLKTDNKNQVIWKDTNDKPYSLDDVLDGSGFSQDTTVDIYAQYKKSPIHALTVKNIDNISDGSGSWSNETDQNAACSSYTNKNYGPSEVEQYSFQYWDCDWELAEPKTYKANEPFTVNILEKIDKKTEINLVATYDFQPSVKVVYHFKDKTTYATESYKQPIDIYASASVQNIDWYYNLSDKNPITKGTKAELPDVIPDVTKPQIDEPVVVDVYEKTKEEPVAPTNPDPINPDPVVPGKIIADKSNTTKAKVKTNNTNETIYYGMGDGDFTVTKRPSFIKKNPLPLNLSQQDYWALLNLIFAIATCVLAFLLIVFGILNKKDEDENIEVKNKWWIRIITVFIGIASLIIFFLTENMNNPWVWIDNWTLLMAIIFIINIILTIVAKHKEKEKEEQK